MEESQHRSLYEELEGELDHISIAPLRGGRGHCCDLDDILAILLRTCGRGGFPLGQHKYGVGNKIVIRLPLDVFSIWEHHEKGSDNLSGSCPRMWLWVEDEGTKSEDIL